MPISLCVEQMHPDLPIDQFVFLRTRLSCPQTFKQRFASLPYVGLVRERA